MREIIIMKMLKHLNVMNLIDLKTCSENKNIWMLMDYLPTNLSKCFAKNKNNSKIMNEKFFKSIAYQILDGVNYLHQNMIIHSDLRLENILYDETKNIVRIGDFAKSRQFDYDINFRYSDVGILQYKPPEVIFGLGYYSTAYDIWSLGCIFVEVITNCHLFGDDNALGVIQSIIKIFGSFDEKILTGYKNFPNSKILEKIQKCEGIGLVNYIK